MHFDDAIDNLVNNTEIYGHNASSGDYGLSLSDAAAYRNNITHCNVHDNYQGFYKFHIIQQLRSYVQRWQIELLFTHS